MITQKDQSFREEDSKKISPPEQLNRIKQLFLSQENSKKISSPEQLDQIMQVASFQKWLPLAAFGTITAAAVIWSIVGRIPVTVNGQGVLVFPSRVMLFQSPGTGRLLTLKVQVGDVVKAGQIVATIDQSELQKKLQQARIKLVQLENQDSDASALQQRRIGLDQIALQQQRLTLKSSLQAAQAMNPLLREKGLESIRSDRQNQHHHLQTSLDLLPTLRRRFAVRQDLYHQGAISQDTLLQAQQELIDGETRVNDAQSQLKQLDVKEADAQRQYLDSLNSIGNLQAQLKEVDTKQASQAQQNLDALTNRKKEIQEAAREIDQLQLQLKKNSQIVSPDSGQVIELSAIPGQLISQGSPVGSIEAQDEGGKLTSVAFFPAGEGKKLKPGMKLQITPATVKREEFGGIIGTVNEVSAFPVTQEGAVRIVGSSEVVKALLSQGPQLEVSARLQPDESTFSSWKWSSSKGPNQKITSGTPTTVRVIVEERAPISFVFPIFKSWTGIY